MFIGRRQDNTIYGLWTTQQWPGQEELADDHAEIAAFRASNEARAAAIVAAKPSAAVVLRALKAKGVITDADISAARAEESAK